MIDGLNVFHFNQRVPLFPLYPATLIINLIYAFCFNCSARNLLKNSLAKVFISEHNASCLVARFRGIGHGHDHLVKKSPISSTIISLVQRSMRSAGLSCPSQKARQKALAFCFIRRKNRRLPRVFVPVFYYCRASHRCWSLIYAYSKMFTELQKGLSSREGHGEGLKRPDPRPTMRPTVSAMDDFGPQAFILYNLIIFLQWPIRSTNCTRPLLPCLDRWKGLSVHMSGEPLERQSRKPVRACRPLVGTAWHRPRKGWFASLEYQQGLLFSLHHGIYRLPGFQQKTFSARVESSSICILDFAIS